MIEKHLDFTTFLGDTYIGAYHQFIDYGAHTATQGDPHFAVLVAETPLVRYPATFTKPIHRTREGAAC
jgi:hypothetical protein